ncbi:MAG: glycoside hydrolase family 3 protein, partial [Rhodococcus ruber]|nr:glycoside hydrolase family 3 protein [Rhodococcus ruber]
MRIRHTLTVAVAAVLAVAGCGGQDAPRAAESTPPPTDTSAVAPPPSPAPMATASAAPACGDELLASLTVRQRLAQLLNVGVTGTADALEAVQSEQIGGIFVGSWTDVSMLANREIPQVTAASRLPLMVTIDEEGGRVSRVGALLGPDPSARVTAQTMTVEETYRMALERGRELRELGVTVDFAPDVDVSSQPDDAVI